MRDVEKAGDHSVTPWTWMLAGGAGTLPDPDLFLAARLDRSRVWHVQTIFIVSSHEPPEALRLHRAREDLQ